MAEQAKRMLSTSDNPWNPWTDFNQWYNWDRSNGYHTLSYLARIAKSSNDLSEADQDQAVEDAIDEILRLNLSGMHIAVTEKTESLSA